MSGDARQGAVPVGIRTQRFKVFDYYTEPWADAPARTPSPVMIAALDWATGAEDVFAWHLIAERELIPAEEILARRDFLEQRLLQEFAGYVRGNRKVRWLHWGLRKTQYGFPALLHRAKVLGVDDLDIPDGRRIDLADYLKQLFGEGYIKDPRLEHLIRRNRLNDHQLLNAEELTTAFRAGDYARMLASLQRKLGCIAHILGLLLQGQLRADARPVQRLPLDSKGPGARWVRCVRSALGGRRGAVQGPSSPPGQETGDGEETVELSSSVPPAAALSRSGEARNPTALTNEGTQPASTTGRQLPVKLGGLGDRPLVRGTPKNLLTEAQFDVIQALLVAGDRGLSKDELHRNSKRGDPLGILRRLAKSDADWQAVIRFPGRVGGRYRIA
jgi:hypothetical protein